MGNTKCTTDIDYKFKEKRAREIYIFTFQAATYSDEFTMLRYTLMNIGYKNNQQVKIKTVLLDLEDTVNHDQELDLNAHSIEKEVIYFVNGKVVLDVQ
eukprot:430868_1